MYLGEAAFETHLPGFDTLHSDDRYELEVPEIGQALAKGLPHRALLHNDAYKRYLKMHKVIVNRSGSDLLLRIGESLQEEDHPEYLEAAGWALAEAGLADGQKPTAQRLDLLEMADENWQRALKMYDGLESTEFPDRWRDDSKPFRLALNIAYTPIMRAIVCGDVTTKVRRKVLHDTIAIAQLAELHRDLAQRQGHKVAGCELYGFMHECNTMAAWLMLDNPAYVPIPSSSRADNGIFNPKQTHDISLVHQNYGTIKKVIPIEVKKERHIESVKRYDAMLITRKDLTLDSDGTIEDTLHSLADIFEGAATKEEYWQLAKIRRTLRSRLQKYQQYDPAPAYNSYNTRTQFRGTREQRTMAHRALTAMELERTR